MDLTFLEGPLPKRMAQRRDLNVYTLLGLASSEDAADRTLAFFLDPEERHGLSTAMIDALLKQLDGGPLLGAAGQIPDETFDCEPFLGQTEWEVRRQTSVASPEAIVGDLSWNGRIDAYLTNDEWGIAVVVENKIGAALKNPLESYVRHAAARYETVLLAVLAQYPVRLNSAQTPWVTRALTYEELFTQLEIEQASLEASPGDRDAGVLRSLDLLDQFREIRQRGARAVDYTNEARYVDEFRQHVSNHAEAVSEFFAAVVTINKLFRARSARLEPLIRERLAEAGLATDWESHSGSVSKDKWVYAWNAYHLVDSDNSVELIMAPDPRRTSPITVKAYPGRGYKLYDDFDHTPLGVGWDAADSEVADAFITMVIRLPERHPRGS